MITFATERDPTALNLGLALLDQNVAGQFAGKEIAYTVVSNHDGPGYCLAIAERNTAGYWPVPASIYATMSDKDAWTTANGMNQHIGLGEEEAILIVVSSMTAKRLGDLRQELRRPVRPLVARQVQARC